jgi:ABC-type Fe3+/spermidine/putrescine transport system ATPase subunit
MAFVSIRNLRKSFDGVIAVDGVSLDVEDGHTLALLGPSGCGKTTILRCLAGLETADEGAIEIAGKPVFDHAAGVNLMPEERELGIVFQSYAVWPHMSVAENVAFPLMVRGVPKDEMRDRTARILELVGLSAASQKGATALSGGQQQRVALARALIHEPRLVLFDEPMSNLDAQLRAQMRMELNVLQDRLGFTAIYVTHDQAEAFALAETVAVMNQGRIETVGEPRRVFHRPATPFVAQFLGLNVMRGRVAAAHGEFARVRLADGVEMWGSVAAPLREGTAVLLCVRKEHIAVRGSAAHAPASAPAAAQPPHEQVFAAQIRAASFLGLEEECIVAIGGVEFGSIQTAHGFGAGARVEAVIKPADCVLFADVSAG